MSRKLFKERNTIIILVLITILFNTLLFIRYYDVNARVLGDARGYELIAKSIIEGKSDYDGMDIGEIVTPGYSLFIALPYYFLGYKPLYVYLLQILLNIISIILFYKILKKVSSPFWAFAGSFWLILYYPLWRLNFQLMMETLTVLLLLLVLYSFQLYKRHKSLRILILHAVLWGVFIFVNNRFVAHLICLLILLIVSGQLLNFQIPGKKIIFIPIIVILCLTPWHIRQYKTYDKFVFFAPSRIPDQARDFNRFYSYEECLNNIKINRYNKHSKDKALAFLTSEKYQELKDKYEWRKKGINRYYSRFWGFLQVIQTKPILMYGIDARIIPPASILRNITEVIILLPMMLLFPLGLYRAFKNRNILMIISGIFVLCHWGIHTIIHYNPRYRLVIIPLIFMVAFYGLNSIHIKFKHIRALKK